MYIIADVEWVENDLHRKSPTQLSAVRVNENWEILEEFSTRIRPVDTTLYDWDHMAYTGGIPNDFITAPRCYDAFHSFAEWVFGDTVCLWSKPSAEIYTFVNKSILKAKELKSPIILNEYVSRFLRGEEVRRGSAYKLARARNISVPLIEHDSRNDVFAILHLLRGISFPYEALMFSSSEVKAKAMSPGAAKLDYLYDINAELLHKNGCELISEETALLGFGTLSTPIKKKHKACSCVKEELRQAKRARVIDEINRTQYTFMYAEKGKVFHRYNCGLLHNADHVLGTVKYDTIAKKGLRPCRVCSPSPEDPCRPCGYMPSKDPRFETEFLGSGSESIKTSDIGRAWVGDTPEICRSELLKQDKNDLLTLSQEEYVFFVASGYQNFHRRTCPRLEGRIGIRGFKSYAQALKAGLSPCKTCKPTRNTGMSRTNKKSEALSEMRLQSVTEKQKNEKKAPCEIPRYSLKQSELAAVLRLEQAQKERNTAPNRADMTEQEKADFYTLTQPRFAFFAAKGYQAFHTRNCHRLMGRCDIRGFDTFAHAKHAGYTPCKYCKPTSKYDMTLSIPIDNQIRASEKVEDLANACKQYGYPYLLKEDVFALETPVGKWKIYTKTHPVTVDHINVARDPLCTTYHQQHRIFLSMLDALNYINKHDTNLMESENSINVGLYLRRGRKWNEA